MGVYLDDFSGVLNGSSSPWRSEQGAPYFEGGQMVMDHQTAVSRGVTSGSYVSFTFEFYQAAPSGDPYSERKLAGGAFPEYGPPAPPTYPATPPLHPLANFLGFPCMMAYVENNPANNYWGWRATKYQENPQRNTTIGSYGHSTPPLGYPYNGADTAAWEALPVSAPLTEGQVFRMSIFMKASSGRMAMATGLEGNERFTNFFYFNVGPFNYERVLLFAPYSHDFPSQSVDSEVCRISPIRVVDELSDDDLDAYYAAYQAGGPQAIEDLLGPPAPTFSTLFPAATAKPSHARILRAHRTPDQARAFHESLEVM